MRDMNRPADKQRSELVERIHHAFRDVSPPSGENLWCPGYIDIWGDGDCMTPKAWPSIPLRALRGSSIKLTIASVDAFAFWLPRYLLAAIEEPDGLDVGMDGLIVALRLPCPVQIADDKYHRSRFDNLTGEQKSIVRDVLELVRDHPAYEVLRSDLGNDTLCALRDYWGDVS